MRELLCQCASLFPQATAALRIGLHGSAVSVLLLLSGACGDVAGEAQETTLRSALGDAGAPTKDRLTEQVRPTAVIDLAHPTSLDAAVPDQASDAAATGHAAATDTPVPLGELASQALRSMDPERPILCDDCEAPARLVKLGAGWEHVCALTANGRVLCWGGSFAGETGTDPQGYQPCIGFEPRPYRCRYRPTRVRGIQEAVDIAVGYRHTCALLKDGSVRCWGANTLGQLGVSPVGQRICERPGIGSTPCSDEAVTVPGIDDGFAIAAGLDHSCVLRNDGRVSCWGSPRAIHGDLWSLVDCRYNEHPSSCYVEPIDQPLPGRATALSAGTLDTAVLLEDGTPFFWGAEPSAVSLPDTAREAHSGATACIVTELGGVECWGNNQFGQLGYGCSQKSCDTSPVAIRGFGAVAQFESNSGYSCALSPAGEIRCIGNFPGSYNEETGYCKSCAQEPCSRCNAPLLLYGPSDVTQIALGWGVLCALTSEGDFWCTGGNGSGTLGAGIDLETRLPLRPATCFLGYADCDRIPHNGCETYVGSGTCSTPDP